MVGLRSRREGLTSGVQRAVLAMGGDTPEGVKAALSTPGTRRLVPPCCRLRGEPVPAKYAVREAGWHESIDTEVQVMLAGEAAVAVCHGMDVWGWVHTATS